MTLCLLPHDPVPDTFQGFIWVIGNLDGIHRGHQALIQAAQELGQERARPVGVMSFLPHPRTVFEPERPFFRLTPPALQREELARLNVDCLWLCAFDALFAAKPAQDFLEEYLFTQAHAAGIVVGDGFRFGHRKEGDGAFLRQWCESRAIPLRLVPPVTEAGEIVSSSRIRETLQAGDVTLAARWLGHPFRVREVVIHGEKRGRTLGFPTLNMRLDPSCGLRHGIYAVTAEREGQFFTGVASFGQRPVFDNGAPLLETHLFDFQDTCYGETLTIAFEGWIRPERNFSSVAALVDAMNADAAAAKKLVSGTL
jgi:riboflavin kinase / FMN adenylyltransferase